jgi:aryl-alcohol dehydrogenase-like predicted oxidoreductase
MSKLTSRLGLGVAQMPLDTPTFARGRSAASEVLHMLSMAGRSGLSVMDATSVTAAGLTTLATALPQTPGFRVCLSSARADRGADGVETHLLSALDRLGLKTVDSVVISTASELFGPQGQAAWDRLRRLQDRGLIAKLGISLFASDDCLGLVRRFKPDMVQAPGSLLDQRMLANGTLARIADLGVEVQLRSLFLSGLLFLPPDRMPNVAGGAASRLSKVRRMIAEGRSDPLQAALGFALSRPEASTVLVNASSVAELSAVIAAASNPPPDLDWDDMALEDAAVLDAPRWAAA